MNPHEKAQEELGAQAARAGAKERMKLRSDNERMAAALKEIIFMAGMPVDIPPLDVLANIGATATVALVVTHADPVTETV